jgi:hypothetical protein
VIAGFRINYATREEPDQVQITVTSPSGARQESIRAKVLQALGEIGKGAKFVVERSGGQPTGPMTPQLGRSRSRRGRSIVSPVALPPGRARLATCPMPTGSPWLLNTIGTSPPKRPPSLSRRGNQDIDPCPDQLGCQFRQAVSAWAC